MGSANTPGDPFCGGLPADRTRPSGADRGHPTLAATGHARPTGANQAVAHGTCFDGRREHRARRLARPHTHDIDETRAPGTTIACPTTAPTISLGTSAPHIRPKDQSQCQQSDQTPS